MHALILSCNTGQGHNAAGLALLESLRARGFEGEMQDALSFAGLVTSKAISEAYLKMAADAPWLFYSMYKASDIISSDRIKSPVYFANGLYAQRISAYIEAHKIDTVICPHLFPAEALTYLRRRHGLTIPCYSIATDYTCIPFLEETDMDAFFTPHADLRSEFVEKGLPPQKLIPTGIPTAGKFRVRVEKDEARRRLNLEAGEPMLLVMTGSMGFGHTMDLIEKLRPSGARVCVMTGRSEKLYAQVTERFGQDAQVRAVAFTDEVPLYMDACDVLLTKPGGLSSTEAAVKNVPLVLTAPIPGCETCNARFFAEHGMATLAPDAGEAALAAVSLLVNKARRESMLANQRRTINAHAADDIIDAILAQ